MNKSIVLLLCALLAACSTTPKSVVQVQYKNVVITTPDNLLKCPQIGKLPNPETLTVEQVNSTIAKLVKYNKTCGINMESIKEYQRKALIAVESND